MGDDRRSQKLQQLFEEACAARGWSRTQLANALGRDPSRLGPASGNPKIDLVVALASVLQRPLADVVRDLAAEQADGLPLILPGGVDPELEQRMDGLDGDGLYELAMEQRRRGANIDVIVVSRRYRSVADDPESLSTSIAIECVGWMTLGRYTEALEVAKRGLLVESAPKWLRENHQVNAANCLYLLWRLTEALNICSDLLDRLPVPSSSHAADLNHRIGGLYVRGNVLRRLMSRERSREREFALRALSDLTACVALSAEHPFGPQGGVRSAICRYAILQVSVVLGELSPSDAIHSLLEGLEADGTSEHNCTLEALAWSCIIGCQVAQRHLTGPDRARTLAIFLNKIIEIADHLSHAAFLAIATELEIALAEEEGGNVFESLLLDAEDERLIAIGMGGLPSFRSRGLRLLRLDDPEAGPADRLERLLDLACLVKRIGRGNLARLLDRHPSRLVPASGVSTLDFTIRLAHILGWSPADTIETLLPADG